MLARVLLLHSPLDRCVAAEGAAGRGGSDKDAICDGFYVLLD